MKQLHDRTCAITGAGSGIGRALALSLGKRNCRVALSDINMDSLEETARLVDPAYVAGQTGGRVICTQLDVSARDRVHAWAESTFKAFGSVNLVFNNAGVAQAGTVEANSYQDYEWVMGINFWGVVSGTKAFLPFLKQSGEGHIVNISSVFGLCAQPTQSAYNASKFAVRGFTESLRVELDMMNCGVSATCVHPGGIKTGIVRASRMNSSVVELLGQSEEASATEFEKNLRTTPEDAAETILRGVQRNSRRVLIGADAWGIDMAARLLPSSYQRILGGILERRKGARA
jgi:NAD(P)-dependent dehydrogenase (short-subunit alcohol dehydrogenase family)